MKTFSRFSILAVLLVAFAGSAVAVEYNFNALVDIVEGITVTETTPLNFGVLVKNDGEVIVAADGAVTNDDALIIDDTNISQGIFTVDSAPGADLQIACVAGTPVDGLALTDFTASWDGGAEAPAVTGTPALHTIVLASVSLEIGATLTVTKADVEVADNVQIPYTMEVVFQ